jgi:predicted ribosome quality control (RQC) complex YloA/Tae2 family protein
VHNNFYFFRQLVPAIASRLNEFTLVSCFSQEKDELILEFNNSKVSFFIRANLTANFSCLSFPAQFARARKNSVDLFDTVILKKVVQVRAYQNERSFSIELEGDQILLFKMHGNRANVILISQKKPIALFKNQLVGDREIDINSLDRSITFSKEFFLAHQNSFQKEYFTFGKQVWSYLDSRNFSTAPSDQRWELFRETIQRLEGPEFLICEIEDKLVFSLVPVGKVVEQFSDPLIAITEFYQLVSLGSAFLQEKNKALQQLRMRHDGGLKYIEKNKQKLREIKDDSHYQAWGDLIMANMQSILPGSEKVTLENFYDDNRPIDVRLNKDLNAQKNAEVYYRKAKNQHIEIQKLEESISAKEKEIDSLARKIVSIDEETGFKNLRKLVDESGLASQKEKQAPSLPYHEFEFKGFKIWVGKSAEGNDTLTLKHSFKEDLWLHAKDVAGSHVLIKYQSGKNFPKDVIERAAQLAAAYSKRKNETLCPVAVTPKKFVRKRKGDPAGAVVVEREEVILVTPGRF